MSAVLVLGAAVQAEAADPGSAGTQPPTRAQIRAALRRAESSRYLWTTVNICNTRLHPGVVGIRAQMPALGFAATLRMRFEIEYWSVAAKTYKRVPGTIHPVSLGVEKSGLYQEGVQFSFPRHSGTLRGSVRFEWDQGHRVLGRATHTTTRGHRDADFGDPAHYSASRCLIS